MISDPVVPSAPETAPELLRSAMSCVREVQEALRTPDLQVLQRSNHLLDCAIAHLRTFHSVVAGQPAQRHRELLASAFDLQREVIRLAMLFSSFAEFCALQLCVLGQPGACYSPEGALTGCATEPRLLVEG
jgi:hypothetical protein